MSPSESFRFSIFSVFSEEDVTPFVKSFDDSSFDGGAAGIFFFSADSPFDFVGFCTWLEPLSVDLEIGFFDAGSFTDLSLFSSITGGTFDFWGCLFVFVFLSVSSFFSVESELLLSLDEGFFESSLSSSLEFFSFFSNSFFESSFS